MTRRRATWIALVPLLLLLAAGTIVGSMVGAVAVRDGGAVARLAVCGVPPVSLNRGWQDPCFRSQMAHVVRDDLQGGLAAIDTYAAGSPEFSSRCHLLMHGVGARVPKVSVPDLARSMVQPGCEEGLLHGVLQAQVTAGAVDTKLVESACGTGSHFGRRTCVHGMGHGLLRAAQADAADLGAATLAALRTCEDTGPVGAGDPGTCASGVLMEREFLVAGADRSSGERATGPDTLRCGDVPAFATGACAAWTTSRIADPVARVRACGEFTGSARVACDRGTGYGLPPEERALCDASVDCWTGHYMAHFGWAANDDEAVARECPGVSGAAAEGCWYAVGITAALQAPAGRDVQAFAAPTCARVPKADGARAACVTGSTDATKALDFF